MSSESRQGGRRRPEPALRLELTAPKIVPMTPGQHRELIQILAAMIVEHDHFLGTRSSADGGPARQAGLDNGETHVDPVDPS